jgi:homoisocitrate dehydrogenase
MKTICLIEGDGVGTEVIPAAVEVLRALKLDLQFTQADAGWACFQRTGDAIPDATIEAVAQADATLFGAISSPSNKVEGYRSPILTLRKRFDLYANLRPTQSLPGAFSRPNLDLLIVRENTEGLYAGRERREGNDTAITERVITRKASERIVRMAFEQARARAKSQIRIPFRGHNPKLQTEHVTRNTQHATRNTRVTIVHKANVLKETDGLFREAALSITKEFSDIPYNELLVDAMAMRLVKDPETFDVIVTTNLFGDILSDEAAGLIGGLGVAPSANIGTSAAVFEPVHGSAPDIAGKGIANPIGAILSAAMMLDYLQLGQAANRVRDAVDATIRAGVLTADLGGQATTSVVVEAVIERVGKG